MTTAASISTAPVSILTFGSASLVSIPANAVGGFVLGPMMFLGMLSLLLGFVSEWASAPLNVVAGLFIAFLLAVLRLFAERAGRRLHVSGRDPASCARAGPGGGTRRGGRSGGPGRRRSLAYGAQTAAAGRRCAAATAALVAAALPPSPAPVRPPDRPTLTFLSVGEGAASLLQVPGGPTVLIDAGPEPVARKLRQHGVGEIDLLVLSHGHADHVAGLSDVIGQIPVRLRCCRSPGRLEPQRHGARRPRTGALCRWDPTCGSANAAGRGR